MLVRLSWASVAQSEDDERMSGNCRDVLLAMDLVGDGAVDNSTVETGSRHEVTRTGVEGMAIRRSSAISGPNGRLTGKGRRPRTVTSTARTTVWS